MEHRPQAEQTLHRALRRAPVVLLVGARQVGKTTLARTLIPPNSENYFDLENPVDLARLEQPMLALGDLTGTVVIAEVQRHPDLFPVLRVLGLISHQHGGPINAASIAGNLDIGESTVRKYLDGLRDALLIRSLPPWHAHQGKQLVRTPRTYLRDTGLLHALWGNVHDQASLLRHTSIGSSWEGHVIEEALRRAGSSDQHFWRTRDGAGLNMEHLWVVYPGARRYRLAEQVTALPFEQLLAVESLQELH